MVSPTDLRLSSGEDLEPQPFIGPQLPAGFTRPATVLSTVMPPPGATTNGAASPHSGNEQASGGTNSWPPSTTQGPGVYYSGNSQQKAESSSTNGIHASYNAIIGPNASWIHDAAYSSSFGALPDVNQILMGATKMVAGFASTAPVDNPVLVVTSAFKIQEHSPQLHKWYGSLKGLYDGFPDVGKFLDGDDIAEGLRLLANLVSNEGWGPTVMIALICEHACRKPESSRSRATTFALYSLLSAPNEDALIEALRRAASHNDQVHYVSINNMAGVGNRHYAKILKVDECDGPMWKLCLHIVLSTLQAVEFTPINIQDLRQRWLSISQKKDEYIIDFVARESTKFEEYARALMHLGITVPSSYERLVSLTQRLQPNMKALLGKHMRSKDLSLYAVDYDYLCRVLIGLEKSYYAVYEFESHGGKSNSKSNDWVPVQQSTRRPPGPPGEGPYKGKPKHDCPHCGKKGVRHPPEVCYSNPARINDSTNGDKKTEGKSTGASLSSSALAGTTTNQDETAVPQFMVMPSETNRVESRLHVPCAEVSLRQLDHCHLVMGIDSFSEVSIVDRQVVSKLQDKGISLDTRTVGKRTCRAACGSLFSISLEVNLPVIFNTDCGPRLAMIWCYAVTNFKYPHILLGASTLSRMRASIDLDEYIMRIKSMDGVMVQLLASPPTVPPVASAPSSDLEDYLVQLSDEELYQWHVKRCEDLPTPKLSFKLKDMVPSVTRKYPIPARLRESVELELQKLARQGVIQVIREDDIGPNAIISPGFAKDKGRPGPNGCPAVRLLCDFSALNAVISSDLSAHWTRSTDDLQDNIHTIPSGSQWFFKADISNAYFTIPLDAEVVPLTTCRFGDIYIQWLRLPQGLNLSALYFPFALKLQLDHLYPIKGFWRRMFSVYLDDVVGHGKTKNQAEGRCRILLSALRAIDKPVSDKEPTVVCQSLDCLGLTLSDKGWSLSEANVKKLQSALATKPKSNKQLRSLVGVYNYGVTAFSFSEANEFSSLMAPLHDAVNVSPFKWTDECEKAQQRLLSHLVNAPRAYLAYEDLLSLDSNSSSLCITTDASLIGTGAHLWFVGKPAIDVSIPDLRVGGRAQLIGAHSSLLDQSQQRWHVFEKECYAIFQAFAKWRALIVSVTRLDDNINCPSVVLFSDSTVAIAKFLNENDDDLFSGKTAIKARRFRAWQMEMAEFDHIPIRLDHIPGTCNVLSDLFSRCAERLEAMSSASDGNSVNDVPIMPINLPIPGEDEDFVSTAEPNDAMQSGDDHPLSRLALTSSQAEIIMNAYPEDESMFLSVRIKAIWAAANNIQDLAAYGDLTTAEKSKAKAWVQAGKFILSPICKDNEAVGLFTQSTNREQDMRRLPWVLVIPGPATFVNEQRMVTAYDPHQQVQAARYGLLLYAHDCRVHLSYDRALLVLQTIEWWPGMSGDLLSHINNCDLCLRLYPSKHLPYRGVIVGDSRFSTISIDHKNLPVGEGISYKYALSITCAYSGWTIFVPQEDLSSTSTALCLYSQWLMRFGCPQHLYCDRGKAFNNALMKDLLAMTGTSLHLAMTGHPQGNSMIERRHRVLQQVLNVHYETCGILTDSDIVLALSHAEMVINQVPNRDGFSVYARVFGMCAPPPSLVDINQEDRAQEAAASTTLSLVHAIRSITSTLATRYNLTKDARAKENELYMCRPEVVNQRDRLAKEQLRAGDMVWLEGNQQAKIDQVLYDDRGAVRGIIANNSTWSMDKISIIGRETVQTLPALPRVRSSTLAAGDYVLYKQEELAGVGKVLSVAQANPKYKVQPMDPQSNNSFYPLWRLPSGEAVSRKRLPVGGQPVVISIDAADVVDKLYFNNYLPTESSKDAMWHAGVELPSHNSHDPQQEQ